MPGPHEVPARIRDLAAQLAQPKAMRRGSFSQRYVKCSKSGCPCASDPEARHGPYFSLTRGVGGRTRSRFISAGQAERVRRQVEAGQHFRRQVEVFWEACEQWANAQLETPAAASEAAKKRAPNCLGSRSGPRGRSPLRSGSGRRVRFRGSGSGSSPANAGAGGTSD